MSSTKAQLSDSPTSTTTSERAVPKAGWVLFGVGLLALCALATIARVSGCNPPSLWLDDQWVGLVVRRMTFEEFFEVRPPVPIGFVVLLKLASAFVNDPELGLQIVPFLASILVIPTTAMLVTRLTSKPSLGFLVAASITVSPVLTVYSVATKQYTLECLATAVLLWIGSPLLLRWSARRALVFVGTATVILPVCFSSILVTAPLLHVALVWQWLRETATGERLRSLGIAAVYDLVVALAYVLLLKGQSNDAMRDYWTAFFMPLDSAGDALEFIGHHLSNLVVVAFPSMSWQPISAVMVPALVVLVVRRETRAFGVFALLFVVQMLVLSALKLFPLGNARTDIYSIPITLAVIALALNPLFGYLTASLRLIAVALAAASLAFFAPRAAHYGTAAGFKTPCADATLADGLQDVLRPEDSLLIVSLGVFSAGYYTSLPTKLVPDDEYAHGFDVEFMRYRTWTLRGYEDPRAAPGLFERDFELVEREGPDRVIFYATSASNELIKWFVAAIEKRGFQAVRSATVPRGGIVIFEKK